MDTDFNHDPAIIPQMIKFLEYYDIIIGSRFVMAGGMEDRFRQFSSQIYNYGIRLLFGTPVHDNLSGFFSIYRDKLEALDLALDNLLSRQFAVIGFDSRHLVVVTAPHLSQTQRTQNPFALRHLVQFLPRDVQSIRDP